MMVEKKKYGQNWLKMRILNMFLKILYNICSPNGNRKCTETTFCGACGGGGALRDKRSYSEQGFRNFSKPQQ
jgi:hypothetical protein